MVFASARELLHHKIIAEIDWVENECEVAGFVSKGLSIVLRAISSQCEEASLFIWDLGESESNWSICRLDRRVMRSSRRCVTRGYRYPYRLILKVTFISRPRRK